MGYQECYKETNELAAERYELVAERIVEIAEAAQAPEPFAEYFRTNAAYLQSLRALYEKGKSGSLAARSMEECETDNEALYGEILPEAYGHSYANPATPLHVWERRSAERSRFLRHIFGRHAGRFSAEI